jgi:hypothetical protein
VTGWLRVLLRGRVARREDAETRTIDTAAVVAEARVFVGAIRDNLDRMEELARTLPAVDLETGENDLDA